MSETEGPVRVGRFEWERLMLMSVPHPTNFKLLPIGVFMSADGGKARPGNGGLAMFGPHEKTWAKLLRWAVDEGWLLLVERGGARRGPNKTTLVRASVYAASVPQQVWKRREDILGSPPFRSAGFEGSAPDSMKGAPGDSPEGLKGAPDGSPDDADSMKGAPETPFNSPDPSMKGAPRDSLPGPLKGAIGSFEGSDPSFEGSVSGFEGSAWALPHHVVLSSRSDSSSTSSTTVVAEDSADVTDTVTTEDGGGGGNLSSSEDQEQDKPLARAESFVDSLDHRGKRPGQTRRAKLVTHVAAAFKAGWTERGLRRYLDISDDPTVRNPAAVYAHRLAEDELPDAAATEAVTDQLPPACQSCLSSAPESAHNVLLRRNYLDPISGGPCPRCHPASVGQSPKIPPVCDACFRANPAAQFNIRFRQRQGAQGMESCPDCHPALVAQQADGGMWERAAARAQQRMASGDWRGAGTDERVAGWMALSRGPGGKEKRPQVGRRYSNDVWHRPADPAEAAKIPHCGNPNCDPDTRLKTEPDWTGEPHTSICGDCHPSTKF